MVIAPIAQWIEYEFAELEMTVRFCLGAHRKKDNLVGSHSGQLHRFRKPKGVTLTQVRILHPPLILQ